MSQTPNQTLQNSGANFTPTIHTDTYPYIAARTANLAGKAVFITGASRGIGRATALSFARAGASHIAIAARGSLAHLEAELQAAAQSAGKPVPQTLSVAVDVTDAASVAAAVAAIEAAFGRLDVLVNNAGYLETFAPLADTDPADWWRAWEINVKGPFLVTRALLPLLLRSENGDKTVISVSSITAHMLQCGGSAYMTSKLALLRLHEFVCAEYGGQGVLAYCIHPGAVVTDLANGMPEESKHILIDQPQLAADTLVWLCKERREWLAGRYVSSTWDMEELLGKREEVVKGDLLKVRMAVVEGN
ncbi:uncharacterized protein K452DRAFT_300972 [Aplosporella prunicola CBS 121167]|uniref:Uncharacterized protein n=1 Tax=Aplosporella prunicola CBS 121167 TaxID=1176127 RepID=A0A6A6B571_9PEZI|nr:uncharacterized protein K452DRAFT_300972 [Aplosporella prunicola CBS 121167]KAF2138425.1 hypothetical protein K452DRAFT_300972 [Aplosporella prunicola CBS 121167]